MLRSVPLHLALWLVWMWCPGEAPGQEEAEHWVTQVDWSIEPFEKPLLEARPHFRRARLHLRDGNAAAALQSLYEALEIDPERSVLHLYAGYAHLRLGEIEKATSFLDRARLGAPYDPQSFGYLGRCHELAGRHETALDRYLQALARQPDDPELWKDVQRVARQTGRTVTRSQVEKQAHLRRGEDGRYSILLTRRAQDPITLAWLSYAATRVRWLRELHQKRFPGASGYRLTYPEECEAWHALVKAWLEFKREHPGLSDPDLDHVASLEDRGLLDGFVLVEYFAPPFIVDLRAGASCEAIRYLREIVTPAEGD